MADAPQREPRRSDRGFRILAEILDDADRNEFRDMLFDAVTDLPSLQFLLSQVRSTLETRSQVGLLTLIVNPQVRLEELFGWVTFDQVRRTVAAALQDIKAECLRDDDTFAELSVSGNSFVFVLSPPRYQAFVLYDDLAKLRERITQRLMARLAKDVSSEVMGKFDCSMGCAVLTQETGVPVQRLVLRALDQAYADAFRARDAQLSARVSKLSEILERRELVTLYQPVVDLYQGTVLGYEALTRGPAGELQDPALLFKLAEETEALWKLDRTCRELALERAASLPEGALLFLNTDPDSVFDPALQRSQLLKDLGGRVVLEITEKDAISDFALFRRALEVIRKLGLKLAIDDVGSAYSGLRLIAEIRPDFVKLDMAITGNLADSVVQQDVVRTVAKIADSLNAPLIIEGIERREQLDAVVDLGLRYAQGYFFGMPEAEFKPLDSSRMPPPKSAGAAAPSRPSSSAGR